GCGSSREHAPWALMDFGIKCVISTSFADIFYNNCFQNGLLPVVLKAHEVQQLMDEARGGNHVTSIDLEAQTVTSPSGAVFRFDIDAQRKAKMLQGLDAIGETLQAAPAIDLYEQKRALDRPWLERA
ncbi:3-isopropylmalate dehydratase small subunit, partial [Phenylobacterium sp.]